MWQCRQSTSFEEAKDAQQQRAEHAGGRQAFQRLGKDCEHRDAEERTDGIAHEPRNQPCPARVVDEKNARCDEQAAQAAEHAQPERDEGNTHLSG